MKKLLIISILFLFGFNSFSQSDTTVTFTETTITQFEATLLFESDWTMDSSNFDVEKDSIFAPCKWVRKDSIYVNENRYKIVEIKKSKNPQGIKRRKLRRIRYQKETRTKTIIKY